jgi:D-alanyl-D-alanine carboxypeptidase/D-alanyl-D-alanine-endopeptidase (penicillin-binding protein 4)
MTRFPSTIRRLLGAVVVAGVPVAPVAALAAPTPDAPLAAVSAPIRPPARPSGLPRLRAGASCPVLQQRLASVLGAERNRWSVTVADDSGRILADVNGTVPRVPASNQKLLSTAFALDRLGPDHRLATRLWRMPDGKLKLTGEGDPDLGLAQLQRLSKLALGQGGSSGGAAGSVTLQLAELPASQWWPAGWHPADRQYAYGAPVTRLALTSNSLGQAVSNPAARLRTLLDREISRQGGRARLELVPASDRSPGERDGVLLHEESSAPMHALLSLANTESHNFTAEVLLRQAAGTWNHNQAIREQYGWLSQQGLPMQGIRLADGSGLDRANRLTSQMVAALLVRMAHHPYNAYYQASMAIAGQRGTLRSLYRGTSLAGRFRGKTGTLRGVRSISGTLETADGPRHVSMIANGAAAPNGTMGQLLRQTQALSPCPAPAAAVPPSAGHG